MEVIQGDLIQLAEQGRFDVIIHGCNCFRTMGAGIAKQIAHTYPEAVRADSCTLPGDKKKLGDISVAWVKLEDHSFAIVNAYTQYRYGPNKAHAEYRYIRECFQVIKDNFHDWRIGYPKIGCGYGGLKWNNVKEIIDEELEGEYHTLVEYNK